MIKASFVLAAAFSITWFLRRRSAAERHLVWAAAIIAGAALPLFTLFLPSWQPELAQRVAAVLPAISAAGTAENLPGSADIAFRANAIEFTALDRIWPIVWLAGSIGCLLVAGMGVVRQRSVVCGSSKPADPALVQIATDVAREVGCRRPVRIRCGPDQSMPMTWGILRPQILFPACANDWSDERKRVVLAHEFGHVSRFDRLFQVAAQIACAMYWFNPLFWVACNRLYRESEHACDDIVINLGVDAREYASHLLGIARSLQRSASIWPATLAIARQSTLEKRFAALLDSALNREAVTRRVSLCAAIMTLSIILPLAAMRVPAASSFAGAVDTNPDSAFPIVEQYRTPPLYSDEARHRGIEGSVTVEVRVGTDGTVKRLHVVKGLGYGLDQNAMLAVRDWRFVPARRNGVPLEATTRIDVEFNLRTAALNEEIANDMATRIGPGVSPPQVVHRVDPQYSAATTRDKPDGAAVLDAVILEDGTPKIIRVIRSLDWEVDELAISALQQWRFSPAMKDGMPVKVRMNIAVSFQSQ
jgi:TonB family protein